MLSRYHDWIFDIHLHLTLIITEATGTSQASRATSPCRVWARSERMLASSVTRLAMVMVQPLLLITENLYTTLKSHSVWNRKSHSLAPSMLILTLKENIENLIFHLPYWNSFEYFLFCLKNCAAKYCVPFLVLVTILVSLLSISMKLISYVFYTIWTFHSIHVEPHLLNNASSAGFILFCVCGANKTWCNFFSGAKYTTDLTLNRVNLYNICVQIW